jgi:hypothetical protein
MAVRSLSERLECHLIGREAAANYLYMTTRSLDRLVDRGIFSPVHIPGVRRVLFDIKDLDELIDRGKHLKSPTLSEQAIRVGTSEMADAQA